MDMFRRVVFAFLAVCLHATGALAERVALVIGNAAYREAAPLANPANDAHDIANKLRRMGFRVIDGYDLEKRSMETKIGEFADALEGADTGLFYYYYAGHGIAVNGENYVLPVDARLDQPAKLKLEAIPANDIVDLMGQTARTSVVILDACRNNPFARSLAKAAKTRGVSAAEGLTGMEAASGAFIAFSTKPGYVAMDGTGRNSPFAEALLKNMDTPGLSIGEMMRRVRNDVLTATSDFQRPQWDDDLTESFSLMPIEDPATKQKLQDDGGTQWVSNEEVTAEIEAFVSERYLKPTPKTLASDVRKMYAAEVNSFGWRADLETLVVSKLKFFEPFEKWQAAIVPGSLKVTAIDASAYRVQFDTDYTVWLKANSDKPETGRAQYVLEMLRDGSSFRIRAENAIKLN